MTRRAAVLETPIMKAIQVYLSEQSDVVCWRNNTGRVTLDSGARRKVGLGVGGADLIGVLGPYGVFFALEVKSETGRVSVSQECWARAVEKQGGFYSVVRSVHEATLALTMFRSRAGLKNAP